MRILPNNGKNKKKLKVKVEILHEGRIREELELEVVRGERILDILRKLNLNVEEVVVLVGEEPVPEDTKVTSEIKLKIIPVVPGV